MDSMRSLLSTSDFLQVREHKLSNDLTVWLNEDHSQPKIFGAVVVKAGAIPRIPRCVPICSKSLTT